MKLLLMKLSGNMKWSLRQGLSTFTTTFLFVHQGEVCGYVVLLLRLEVVEPKRKLPCILDTIAWIDKKHKILKYKVYLKVQQV